ncbi:MAG: PQQ-binding-like beta-propeller repeat protein [Planctomycetota bacterium]
MPDDPAPPAETSEFVPASAAPSPAAASTAPAVRPRLWPGVVAMALLWTALTVPFALFPESPRGFIPLILGSMGSFVLAAIWWLAASRVPIHDRVVGIGLVGGGLVLGMMGLFHASIDGFALLFHVGPWLLTAAVTAMLVTRPLGWRVGRYATLAAVVAVGVVAASIRYVGADSGFSAKFLPRWQATAEEQLAAAGPPVRVDEARQPESVAVSAQPGDWPGFRGADRDGRVADGSLAAAWPGDTLEAVWRRDVGSGWGSFCVVGGLAFTQEQRGEEEWVSAYDADTGEPVWQHAVEARFFHSMGGAGPRATPTFDAGKLYTTGAAGDLHCFDAATGEVLWRRSLIADAGLQGAPEWGFAASPLLHTPGDGPTLAILHACDFASGNQGEKTGKVLAYDAATGEVVWQADAGNHSYSSPHLATLGGAGPDGEEPGGVTQVLIATNAGLRSLDPATGEQLWRFEWDIATFCRSTQPLVIDANTVVLSAGYDSGTMRINVAQTEAGWSAEPAWDAPSRDLEPYFNDMVLHEGHLYGIHKKFLVCIDAETGEPTWPRKVKRKARFGNGQLVLDAASGMLLVTTENTGEVLLIEANPETLVIRGRCEALTPDVNWNHPVIAGGRLYVRHGSEAACYELPAPKLASRGG